MERRVDGARVPEAQIEEWVREAEEGYDPDWLKGRMGRPARAGSAARVIPVRLTDDELKAIMARADRERLNRSDAIRRALAEWSAAPQSSEPDA